MMSQKSLRYTHEQNCKGEVVKTEDVPVKRRNANKVESKPEVEVKTVTNKKEIYDNIVAKNVNLQTSEVRIPEELKLEVLKNIQRQQARIKMKEDNLNRLKMQIV
jgi:DNA-binding NtrC family response regulator